MGKASSAKKVARVARSSSASSGPRERFRLGFGSLIAAILILGVLLVAWSRASRVTEGDWTITWGVYVCDAFVPGIGGTATVPPGAPVALFAQEAGLAVTGDAITLPDGRQLTNGFDCGGTPGEVAVWTWPAGADASAGLSFGSELATRTVGSDGERITLAVVAPDTTVPQPPDTPEPAPETTTTAPDTATTAAPEGEAPPASEPAPTEPPADSTTTVP